MWGGRCLTVMCVREPNLPPSAVRVEDVRASEAPGPLSLFLFVPPSLHRLCRVVSPHMLVCNGGGGGVRGYMGVGWRGHRRMGSLRLFPVAVDTCLHACAPLKLSFNPSGLPLPLSPLLSSRCLHVWITSEAPLS